jgi:ligand-binding sensor domain-containing protein
VWARLRGIALLRYQHEAFENMLPTLGYPESVVTAMERGRDNSILTATLGRGAMISRNGRVDAIVDTQALPGSSFVISMAETPNGEFWLGTRGAGVLHVQGTRVVRFTDGLPDLKVNSLLALNDGDVWIGTDKGVVRWTGTKIGRSGIPGALTNLQALEMIRDRAGCVWIAAGPDGLVRVDGQGRTSRSESNGAPAATYRRSSRIGRATSGSGPTAASSGGAIRCLLRSRRPKVCRRGRSDPCTSTMTHAPWFAPTNGGLFWMEDGVVGRITDAGLDGDVVYSIDGANGDVWVGRQRGGVTRLRRSAGGWSTVRFTEADGLPNNSVYAVALARDGALWAGTLSAGASRIVNATITTFTTASGLASNTIMSIAEGQDGTMWFATPNGLSAFSHGSWRTYTTRDGLPSNDINTVFVGPRGIVWIGTSDGLAFAQDDRWRTCRGMSAALRGSILGLAMDQSGSLWLHTIDQVVRINREPAPPLRGGRPAGARVWRGRRLARGRVGEAPPDAGRRPAWPHLARAQPRDLGR